MRKVTSMNITFKEVCFWLFWVLITLVVVRGLLLEVTSLVAGHRL